MYLYVSLMYPLYDYSHPNYNGVQKKEEQIALLLFISTCWLLVVI